MPRLGFEPGSYFSTSPQMQNESNEKDASIPHHHATTPQCFAVAFQPHFNFNTNPSFCTGDTRSKALLALRARASRGPLNEDAGRVIGGDKITELRVPCPAEVLPHQTQTPKNLNSRPRLHHVESRSKTRAPAPSKIGQYQESTATSASPGCQSSNQKSAAEKRTEDLSESGL